MSEGPRKRAARTSADDRPRLRKSLGQHHLRSGATCRPLIEYLAPAGKLVVEVGPGGGILTAELLAAGARVVALELDPDWAATLRSRIDSPDLEIRVADALDFDWSSLPPGARVAGNLPYNVGTAIVERVLKADPPIDRAAFLLQREVVDRITASPKDEAYGALSVLVRLRADSTRLGNVKPGAFVPPPKVDSAFVGLRPRALPEGLEGERGERFEIWLKKAFGQRRKTLVNALAGSAPKPAIVAAIEKARRLPTVRAEELSLEELRQIFESVG